MIDGSIRGCSSSMRSIAMFVAVLAASCGGSPPKLIGAPQQPDYPLELRMRGVEGKVSAKCTINKEGRVVDCRFLQAPTPFDRVVLEALSKRRYEPATQGKGPLSVEKAFTFQFALLSNEIELSPTPPFQPPPPLPLGDDASKHAILPFGATMNRPKQLSGLPRPPYTREAFFAGAEGDVIARCVITKEGQVNRCRIIQGVPYLTNVTLTSLLEQRYVPVRYKGAPVNVEFTFPFRFRLGRASFDKKITHKVLPPTELCAKGRLKVRCRMEDAGAVGSCQLLESSLDEKVDQEVLDAINTHRVRPEPPEGAPTGAEVTLKILYQRRCAPPSQPQP